MWTTSFPGTADTCATGPQMAGSATPRICYQGARIPSTGFGRPMVNFGMGEGFRRGWSAAWRLAGALVLAAVHARADSVRTPDWAVHFNLPDQNPSSAIDPGEWAIRDALVARINALQAGHEACLATYTFDGSSDCCGAAGPILNAVSNALNRGATVRFVVDGNVSVGTPYGANSLAALAARPGNALILVQDDSISGIMHDKLGIFDYGPGERWVFTASWNFTGGACTYQWNAALELRNDTLYAAYRAEFAELLAGRFHDHATKSHAHDGTPFVQAGSSGTGWVRFSPSPSSAAGGNNPLTDITNAIGRARQEIVFALNLCTRNTVRDQLIAAANRGVTVSGVFPSSELDPTDDTYPIYTALMNPANYTTTNRVRLYTAYAKADSSAFDTGQTNLVHAKWMVIDPYGDAPLLIHGSANWSASALTSTTSNDENTLFLPHRDIARVFYAHFKRITGAFSRRSDFWWDMAAGTAGGIETRLWKTDTNALVVQTAHAVAGPWADAWTNRTGVGASTVTNATDSPARFYRATRP
jgi:phosphatidylserine/phosphatidylglycerophosphate/cardiolipin synthase-like enzyme